MTTFLVDRPTCSGEFEICEACWTKGENDEAWNELTTQRIIARQASTFLNTLPGCCAACGKALVARVGSERTTPYLELLARCALLREHLLHAPPMTSEENEAFAHRLQYLKDCEPKHLSPPQLLYLYALELTSELELQGVKPS